MEQRLQNENDGDACENEVDESDDENKTTLVPEILSLVYTEPSLAARKKRVKGGTASIKQLESAHILANSRIGLPTRSRKNYSGTRAGDTWTCLSCPMRCT